MTTDQTREPAADDSDHEVVMTEVEELLEEVTDMDPAEAVEPMARVTALLNSALDTVQERL